MAHWLLHSNAVIQIQFDERQPDIKGPTLQQSSCSVAILKSGATTAVNDHVSLLIMHNASVQQLSFVLSTRRQANSSNSASGPTCQHEDKLTAATVPVDLRVNMKTS